jgi:hypothetical protein
MNRIPVSETTGDSADDSGDSADDSGDSADDSADDSGDSADDSAGSASGWELGSGGKYELVENTGSGGWSYLGVANTGSADEANSSSRGERPSLPDSLPCGGCFPSTSLVSAGMLRPEK